jgi:hypothetical protein
VGLHWLPRMCGVGRSRIIEQPVRVEVHVPACDPGQVYGDADSGHVRQRAHQALSHQLCRSISTSPGSTMPSSQSMPSRASGYASRAARDRAMEGSLHARAPWHRLDALDTGDVLNGTEPRSTDVRQGAVIRSQDVGCATPVRAAGRVAVKRLPELVPPEAACGSYHGLKRLRRRPPNPALSSAARPGRPAPWVAADVPADDTDGGPDGMYPGTLEFGRCLGQRPDLSRERSPGTCPA